MVADALTIVAAEARQPGQSPDRLRQAAEEFEAVFLAQMLEHMASGLTTNAMFGGGHAERTWRSVLHQEYAKAVAQRQGIGIADALVREFLKLQETP